MKMTLLIKSKSNLLSVAASLVLAFSSYASAATVTVLNTDDSGSGSLRAAIAAATTGDTIDIRTTGTVTLLSALPSITLSITIQGPGADLFAVSGAGSFRVFTFSETADVIVSGITIRDGYAADCAGVLNLANSLTMNNVVVTNNIATGMGGGVCEGSVNGTNIIRSVISGNMADVGGGLAQFQPTSNFRKPRLSKATSGTGLYLEDTTVSSNIAGSKGGGAYISANTTKMAGFGYSTFKNNSAGGNPMNFSTSVAPEGAGVFIAVPDGSPSMVVIADCTFNGNSSTGDVGAVANYGALYFFNNTVVGNSAVGQTGGIKDIPSSIGTGILLYSNIIASNTAATDPDITGDFTNSSHNIIGNGSGNTSIIDGVSQNHVGTGVSPIDPKVNPIGNYGGYTETMTLQSDSPAIDQGVNVGTLTREQRGGSRTNDLPATTNAVGGDGTDIGSTEYLTTTAASGSISGSVVDAFGRAIQRAKITAVDLESGATVSALTNQMGRYSLKELEAGGTYIVSVTAKGYVASMPQALYVGDSIKDFNLTMTAVSQSLGTKTIKPIVKESFSSPDVTSVRTRRDTLTKSLVVRKKGLPSDDEDGEPNGKPE